MADRSPSTRTSARKLSPRQLAAGRVVDDASPSAWPLTLRWTLLLILLGGIFLALRGVHSLAETPQPSAIFTEHVVVVGVTGRPELTDADRTILSANLDSAQVGSVAARGRYVPDCAAAGWTTLGAGRRAAVGGLCDPVVANGAVTDWADRQAAAAARSGDAQLGTLAASVSGCVAAIGPGAALAAAKPDGTLAVYATPEQFVGNALQLSCPITIVDAGALSDQIVAKLATDETVTVILTGIGPAAGSDDRSLQVIYRLATTLPGWLTSASTRREAIVTLTDLTRTLIDFGRPPDSAVPVTVDGSPFAVYQAQLSMDAIDSQLEQTAALSDAAPAAYLGVGLAGTVLALIMVAGVVLRRLWITRLILTSATVWLASMMLTGTVPWYRSDYPGVVAVCAMLGWAVILTGAALLLARLARIPAAIAGAALTVAAFTVDAALGGPMQPGSLINSRPIFGLRWYGFGNVSFGAYAGAGLLLAGYVAHRFLLAGRRRAAVVAVALIGFGIVVCEGWPTMGSDFGGVIALTPSVLWLIFAVSGATITWQRLLIAIGSAVLAIGLISVLDWARGADQRSHLGNFVQRIIDGDALDVVSRKAVAALQTLSSPFGVGIVVIGIALWVVIFKYAASLAEDQFSTIRPTLTAVVICATLGSLLNDGGVNVWLTMTSAATVAIAWFCVDYALRLGWPAAASTARR
jgi:hypothetical protein